MKKKKEAKSIILSKRLKVTINKDGAGILRLPPDLVKQLNWYVGTYVWVEYNQEENSFEVSDG